MPVLLTMERVVGLNCREKEREREREREMDPIRFDPVYPAVDPAVDPAVIDEMEC